MKGKVLAVLLSFCVAGAFVLTSCGNINQAIADNISELYSGVYEGEAAEAAVKVVTGRREKEFVMDGASGRKADFTALTVTPTEEFAGGNPIKYAFTAGKQTFEGDLTLDKIGGKYTAELSAPLPAAAEFDIRFTAGGNTAEVTLTNKMQGIITAAQALDLAKLEFKTQLESLYTGGKLNCEIYVRYVNSAENADSGYYWYIAFLQADKSFFACLIDPVNSAIVAKRT